MANVNLVESNDISITQIDDDISLGIKDTSLNTKIINKNEYSTTQEIAIGKWIDGKTIYRKVFTGTITSVSNFNLGSIGTFSTIVSISGYTNINGYITSILQYWSTTLKSILQVQATTGDLYLNAGTDFSNRPYTIIVEYTKTS